MSGLPEKEVSKACVLRARVYKDGTFLGNTETHTFFVGKKYTLPVVSITTDADNLFDYEKGIYVPGKIYDDNYDPDNPKPWFANSNYTQRGDSWKKPAHIEFFETAGTLGFSQNVGVAIHGGASRSHGQKTLRIHASDEYDMRNSIKYELFPGLTNALGDNLDEFKFFILRNSGNDCPNTLFRDAMAQSLVSHTSLNIQAYRPVIVYLNGEYWGVHNIRERQDEHYLANKYDVNKDDVVILSTDGSLIEGEEGDEKHFKDMREFARNNEMSIDSNYEYFGTQMDINDFMDFTVAQMYYHNIDWPGNNMKYWRFKTDNAKANTTYGLDGKWRGLLYDTDYAFGWGSTYADLDSFERLSDTRISGFYGLLYNKLLDNESFKNQFISRFADHLNTSFRSERVVQKISEMHSVLRPEMPVHNKRWNAIYGWNSQTRVMIDFAKQRPDYQRQHIIDFFNLDGTAELKLNTNAEDGLIKLNSIEISKNTPGVEDPNSWTGIYFKGIPVEIEGLPNLGYRFARWESNIQNEKIENNNKISLIPNQDIEITAIFEIATAQPAEEAIEKLPSVERITLEFENDVKLARNLVERTLSESKIGKSDISNIDKLMRLESRIFELKKFEEAKSQKSLRKKFFKW